jgi:hypothetical protein
LAVLACNGFVMGGETERWERARGGGQVGGREREKWKGVRVEGEQVGVRGKERV